MILRLIKISIISVALFSCGNPKTESEEIKSALGEIKDTELIPQYKTVYLADSVELEAIEPLLSNDSIDEKSALTILSNSCTELKADYYNYLLDSYQTIEYAADRLPYQDIANMSRFLIWKLKFNETACFDKIFENAEVILIKGDKSTQNLIVVGLFEGIQNIGGWHKVDYHTAFDKWLRPKSKKAWEELIVFWEGHKK